MEKILLKVNDLNIGQEQYGKLNHASFFVKAGHIAALLGLDYAGPELIAQLFLGKLPVNWKKEHIYYNGEAVFDYSQIKNLVYQYKGGYEAVKNWTVAEYVFSDQHIFFLLKSTLKKMNNTLKPIFCKYHVNIDPMRKIGSLTELECRKVEMIRACLKGAKILILEDECEGMSLDEIRDYASFLHRITDGDKCMLLLCHTENVFQTLADDIILFRKGRIVKKFFNINEKTAFDWKSYLLGNTLIRRKTTIDSYVRTFDEDRDIIYRLYHINYCGTEVDLDFRKGEITTFVILDNKKREDFFLTLSGREAAADTRYIIEGKELISRKYQDFISHKIISASRLKSRQEIIKQMPIEDNLLIPSSGKMGLLQYSFENTNVKRSLYQEFAEKFLSGEKMVKELSSNQVSAMTLERWFIFRPKVMILYDVFVGNDPYGISIIQSYIKKFSNLGAAVILVESSLEYMENISDRIFESIE